ncbi:hypothetical protein H8S95_07555 [Pontibacter sp. KCTC 32443]|uniref:hypothetical protein n=1 Tax=Pontibacter TaxID=323449 RepID=UPI00164D9C9D|nr:MULTISPECIES: hypothetical protein [Pontibacter]MBC5773915.1 hypothetical protein [Pontibacter sp. KCTC 32443]
MRKCRAILFAFSFVALFACDKKESEFYWQVIRTDLQEVSYIPLEIEKHETDSAIVIKYFSPFDSLNYFFDPKAPDQANNIFPYVGHKGVFKFVKKHSIKVDDKAYSIYQYSTKDGTIDAGSEHYWTKELGFFFIRATYWYNYHILQSTDEEKSQKIWRIIKEVHPEIKESFNLLKFEEGKEHIIQKHHRVIPKDYKL